MPVTKGRYSFRDLKPADTPLLARLHAVSFAGQEVWDAKAMSDLMAMPGAFGFIGLKAAEPAGFVIARMAGEDSEIISLGVCPGDRRGDCCGSWWPRLRPLVERGPSWKLPNPMWMHGRSMPPKGTEKLVAALDTIVM